MKNWIYRMLLLFPLLGFGAEGATAKIGGLCFRFDDNQTVQKWNDMAEVFRKYDSRFCMSIISHWIHDPAFSAMLSSSSLAVWSSPCRMYIWACNTLVSGNMLSSSSAMPCALWVS